MGETEAKKANGSNRAVFLPGLREARRKQTMTQRELALMSGVAASTISDLETGRRGAYSKTIKKLREVLDAEVEALTDG